MGFIILVLAILAFAAGASDAPEVGVPLMILGGILVLINSINIFLDWKNDKREKQRLARSGQEIWDLKISKTSSSKSTGPPRKKSFREMRTNRRHK